MRNIQQRMIAAPAQAVGAILDTAAGPDDRLWPSSAWPPLMLDRGLAVGSRGGHGPIRYSVSDYEPGRRIRFIADPAIGLNGYHEFTVSDEGPGRSRLTHTIDARLHGRMKLAWPLAIRWIHEAVLQDLLDNAERGATGTLRGRPARWSLWVRILRRMFARRQAARATVS